MKLTDSWLLSLSSKLENIISYFFTVEFARNFFGDFLDFVGDSLKRMVEGNLIKNIGKSHKNYDGFFLRNMDMSQEELDLMKDLVEKAALYILLENELDLKNKGILEYEDEEIVVFSYNNYLISDGQDEVLLTAKISMFSDVFYNLKEIVKECGKKLVIYLSNKNKEIPIYSFFNSIEVCITQKSGLKKSDIKSIKYELEGMGIYEECVFKGENGFVHEEEFFINDYHFKDETFFSVQLSEINLDHNEYKSRISYGEDMKISRLVPGKDGDLNFTLIFSNPDQGAEPLVSIEIENMRNRKRVYFLISKIDYRSIKSIYFEPDKFLILVMNSKSKEKYVVEFLYKREGSDIIFFNISGVYDDVLDVFVDHKEALIEDFDPDSTKSYRLPLINREYPFITWGKVGNIQVRKEDFIRLILDYLSLGS